MAKRKSFPSPLTTEDVIDGITKILRKGSGKSIEEIANQLFVSKMTYIGDGFFEQEIAIPDDIKEHLDFVLQFCKKEGVKMELDGKKNLLSIRKPKKK